MAYKSIVLFLIALLTSSFSNAGDANLSWTPPTQNEDGSPLIDLASYEIWHGCIQSGIYDAVEIVQAPATTHTVLNLPVVGTCYFAAKATNSVGESSDFSNETSKLMAALEVPGLVTDTAVIWQESQVGPLTISNTLPSNYQWGLLNEGEFSYIDRTYRFQSVPASLVGLDYLRTANSDKDETGRVITFDVNKPVTVFVAHDRDFTKYTPPIFPSWLSSWTNTGMFLTIRSSAGFHDIYSKTFPTGSITLGGNNDEGAALHSMYVVIVED